MIDNRDMSFAQRFVDRQLENAKNTIYNALISMSKPQPLIFKGNFRFCPACGKFFAEEHAEQKPNFCEECGQAFDWGGNDYER